MKKRRKVLCNTLEKVHPVALNIQFFFSNRWHKRRGRRVGGTLPVGCAGKNEGTGEEDEKNLSIIERVSSGSKDWACNFHVSFMLLVCHEMTNVRILNSKCDIIGRMWATRSKRHDMVELPDRRKLRILKRSSISRRLTSKKISMIFRLFWDALHELRVLPQKPFRLMKTYFVPNDDRS